MLLVLPALVALIVGIVAATARRPFIRSTVAALLIAAGLTLVAGMLHVQAVAIVPNLIITLVVVFSTIRKKEPRVARKKERRVARPPDEVQRPAAAPVARPPAPIAPNQVFKMRVPTDQGSKGSASAASTPSSSTPSSKLPPGGSGPA